MKNIQASLKKFNWQLFLPVVIIALFFQIYFLSFRNILFSVQNELLYFLEFNKNLQWIHTSYWIISSTFVVTLCNLLGIYSKHKNEKQYKNAIFVFTIIFYFVLALIFSALIYFLKPLYQINPILLNEAIIYLEIKNIKNLFLSLSAILFIFLALQDKTYLLYLYPLILSFMILCDGIIAKTNINIAKNIISKLAIETIIYCILFIFSMLTFLLINKSNKRKENIKIYFQNTMFFIKNFASNLITSALLFTSINLLLKTVFNNQEISNLKIISFNLLLFYLPIKVLMLKQISLKHFQGIKDNFLNYLFLFVFYGILIFSLWAVINLYASHFLNTKYTLYQVALIIICTIILATSNLLIIAWQVLNKKIIHFIPSIILFLITSIFYLVSINNNFLNISDLRKFIFTLLILTLYLIFNLISSIWYFKIHKISILPYKNQMKFFVIGNINSGKSLYVEKLRQLTNFETITIDNFREKYGSFNKNKEKKVYKKFIQKIIKTPECIVEFSGNESWIDKLLKKLSPAYTYVIYVKTDQQDCLDTLIPEKYNEIPYYHFNEQSLVSAINKYHEDEKQGYIYQTWFDYSNLIFPVESINDFDNLPLNKFVALNYLLNKLKDMYIDSAFLVGSLANGQFNRYSDINIIIESPIDPIIIRNLLISDEKIDAIQKRKNIVSLLIDNTLFDLIVIKNVKEAHEYIYRSQIKAFNKILLINNPGTTKLQKLATTNLYDEAELMIDLIGETDYLSSNLSRLATAGDKYKFYLVAMKLLQNLVRLNALLDKKNDFNFLPDQALKYINNPKIVYTLNLSMTHFIIDVNTYWKENKSRYYVRYNEILKEQSK